MNELTDFLKNNPNIEVSIKYDDETGIFTADIEDIMPIFREGDIKELAGKMQKAIEINHKIEDLQKDINVLAGDGILGREK